jgi:hypothetical protein
MFDYVTVYDNVMGSPCIFGLFVVSGIVGAIISFLVFVFLVWATGETLQSTMKGDWLYSGVLTGVFERFFFTGALGLIRGSDIVAAMIGWIAVKGQVHYQIFTQKDPEQNMSRVYLGLLGSLASLLLAVWGFYLWDTGHTLAHPLTGQKP